MQLLPANRRTPVACPQQSETVVLVADDELAFRQLACTLLRREGYTVISASDGEEALALSRTTRSRIQALVTDVDMPRLDGFALAEHIAQERPETKILIISCAPVAQATAAKKGLAFLSKPFLSLNFQQRIREVLACKSNPTEARR